MAAAGEALGSVHAHPALRRRWSACTPDLNRCVNSRAARRPRNLDSGRVDVRRCLFERAPVHLTFDPVGHRRRVPRPWRR